MAGINRLAVVDDATGTSFGEGIEAFVAPGNYLVSVIAANTTATDAEIYIYSVPFGTSGDPDLWAILAYKLPLPAYNSYETFRFAANTTDSVYVAGSAGVRYFVQGLEQIG